ELDSPSESFADEESDEALIQLDAHASDLLRLGIAFAPTKQRNRLELTMNERLSNKSIARRKRVTPGAVSKSIKKGKQWLTAGALIAACRDPKPDHVDAVFSPRFAKCTPLNTDVVSKFKIIVANPGKHRIKPDELKKGMEVLWKRAVENIVDVYGDRRRA